MSNKKPSTMKTDLVRRFTLAEVVYHAIQVLIYLTMFHTGGALLLQRLFEIEIFDPEKLSNIHRFVGLLLISFISMTIFFSIFFKKMRPLWGTFLEAFKWSFNDIVWFVKMPLNFINHKVTVPPSARFNPGQRMHLLVIMSLIFVSATTGLTMMIYRPGAIGPWIVHASTIAPATFFLGLHTFLALVNPSTRKALKGIVTGFVPRTYAEEHHPLWIKGANSIHLGGYVSRKAVIIVGSILTTIGFIVVWHVGPGLIFAQLTKVVSNGGREVITPGKLISYHNAETDTKHCTSCHEYFNSPQSCKCLKCHKEIKRILANRQGYHGTLTEQCSVCHKEHKGLDAKMITLDTNTFDHKLARFSLLGKHHDLECRKCHLKNVKETDQTRIKYTNLDFELCASCHQNPHPGLTDDKDCLSCHTMHGWSRKQLKFKHNRDSQFKLVDKHSQVSCEKCHKTILEKDKIVQVKLTNVGKHCKDCHDDPHDGQFKAECLYCHSEKGWKDLRPGKIHMADSTFPLKGMHSKIKCDECHKPLHSKKVLAQAKFVGLSHECASCHKDPHKGQMTHPCKTCHTEQGWKGKNLLFVHDKHSSFKLKGNHSKVQCEKCHKPQHTKGELSKVRFAGLSHECALCHKGPHREQISHTCKTCHVEKGWKGDNLLFVHNKHSVHKIKDLHRHVSCSSCHLSGRDKIVRYKPLQKECNLCHNDIDDFMNGISDTIESAPDHHACKVTCLDCHPKNINKQSHPEYAQRCASCHNQGYFYMYFSWMDGKAKKAEKFLKMVEKSDGISNKQKEHYKDRIRTIERICFHNIQLARKMLKELIESANIKK